MVRKLVNIPLAQFRHKPPYPARPGGRVSPEAHPVRPKLPGTRDRIAPQGTTSDPKILRRRRLRA